MKKYIKVEWSELLDWMSDEYGDDAILVWNDDGTYIFVSEELYNRVKCVKETTTQQ